MDELETPSRDTDESDNKDHEESIEPEEMYHGNQQETSNEEPVNSSGTAKSKCFTIYFYFSGVAGASKEIVKITDLV